MGGTLVPHAKNLAIAVRVCFVLGNMTAGDGPSRSIIARGGGIDLLGGILEHYDDEDAKLAEDKAEKATNAKRTRDVADVLTKVIRVMANLAIDEEAGQLLAVHSSCARIVRILDRRRIDTSEELVLNAVSAVT